MQVQMEVKPSLENWIQDLFQEKHGRDATQEELQEFFNKFMPACVEDCDASDGMCDIGEHMVRDFFKK